VGGICCKPIQDVHRPNWANPTVNWIGAIGLTVAVGVAYFFAAELSLALLAKSGGLTMFWLARACRLAF